MILTSEFINSKIRITFPKKQFDVIITEFTDSEIRMPSTFWFGNRLTGFYFEKPLFYTVSKAVLHHSVTRGLEAADQCTCALGERSMCGCSQFPVQIGFL